MNCKQGDLALIVKSVAGNEGKIVRCVKLHKNLLVNFPNGQKQEDVWEIDRKLPSINNSVSNLCVSHWLKPIRDQDGEDEMIKIAGYPKVKEVQ